MPGFHFPFSTLFIGFIEALVIWPLAAGFGLVPWSFDELAWSYVIDWYGRVPGNLTSVWPSSGIV